MNADQFATMVEVLHQNHLTLVEAVQLRPATEGVAAPNYRLQRPTKMKAEEDLEAYLELFEVMATTVHLPPTPTDWGI
ncbi:hypothetical protein EOD39_15004 [Acipenser ruthenus]|uniref:Uncharacterized protein n=1 Tax=Acipenser ruthenus TaxID=7906 RepID=A0A662YKL2_ACIRT|nr:hypothetical protein EOD39_15004 [Acipenser ruthenus]